MRKSPYSNLPYIDQPYNVAYTLNSILDVPSCAQIAPLPENSSTIKYAYTDGHIDITSPAGQELIDGAYINRQISLKKVGTYTIRYYGVTEKQVRPSYSEAVTTKEDFSFTFAFSVVQNRLPLKKWTITEVLNRLFDVAEPIRKGEKPRFRLQGVNDDGTFAAGSQAEKFDKILSPEFAFTKETLRECLKQIGGFIHGEPRLTPKKDGSGTWYYEVSYDMYGGTEQWKHANRRYIANTVSYTAEQFATALDTNPENLINRLKDYTGVTMEPYAGGKKSVRTEEQYVQITETNMVIATQRPIYTVEEVVYIANDGTETQLTPYIFEASVYDSQLSSYDSQYPYSKAYGLRYKQGEKNITALNFKQEHPLSEVFSRYAIVNIIREATGNSGFTPSSSGNGYVQLCFRVTYTPIYNARVKQVKPNYTEYAGGATQIYNQSANLVESRAFGENLKGVIARMGNPEKSRTYMFSNLSEIPKAGMKFDEEYYISGVYTEFYTPYIRCTVALTKDFNRISEYIGIPQYRRYSQISQSMAVERNIVYEEYVVIGNEESADRDCMIGNFLMSGVIAAFGLNQMRDRPLTAVIAWGGSYQDSTGQGFNTVCLPVVASAYGNSISFSWEYADNYSAGPISEYMEGGVGGSKVSGYFQQDYSYSDYYGRMYYYNFDLQPPMGLLGDAYKLPAVDGRRTTSSEYISTLRDGEGGDRTEETPIVVRKDNREKLQVNMQVHFVTNRKGLIIGSALASNCTCVRLGTILHAKLYVLPERIDKFSETVEAIGIALDQCPSAELSIYNFASDFTPSIRISGDNRFPGSGKAWVIAYSPVHGEEERVENEKGEEMTVARVTGGDILLAQNMDISAGQAFEPIFFVKKRNVYKGVVWKDRR